MTYGFKEVMAMSEEVKTTDKTTKKAKKTKIEKRRARRKIVNFLMGVIIFCTLLGVAGGVSTIYLILQKSDVAIDLAALASSEVSFIYDSKGNEVARLGVEDRVNISYNDLPQCVVDAFVAVEDSRYFEHPGFDMPRFAKAVLENIASFSFSQGGSTITMQVIKNSFFAVDTIAASEGGKGVSRKVQEIYYSLKINKLLSKGKLLELYINKINYGGTARGIEVAADYYFDKSAKDLSLVEAAYLAGVVNAPNDYNVYYNPKYAQERTANVLYLMHYHGYITDLEYEMALKVNVADLVVGQKGIEYGSGKTIPNQAYIDIVLNELETLYDINIYTDSVRVYTALNQSVQSTCDRISEGNVESYINPWINYAAAVVKNTTGEIIAVSGGRDYDRARKFNYATDTRVQPGSTIKAILTYPIGIEYGGLSTGSYINDEKITYTGTNLTISNYGGGYHGWVRADDAFAYSYNIPAIKVFRKAQSAVGIDKIKSYIKSIGIDSSVAELADEQYGIGGANCIISPLQLAAAGAALFNNGKYITPHTVTKIEYINSTKEPIVPSYSGTQVMSAGTGWMVAEMMRHNVSIGGTPRAPLFRKSYPTYVKTGTASLPEWYERKYGIRDYTSSKDEWLLVNNGDFSIGSWYGYDLNAAENANTHLTYYQQSQLIDGYLTRAIFNAVESAYGTPKGISKPSDVSTIKFIKGYEPFTAAPSYAPDGVSTTGYVLSKFAKVASWPTPGIDSLADANASLDGNTINVTWTAYPNSEKMSAQTSKTAMATSSTIDGVVQYNVVITDNNGNQLVHAKPNTNSYSYTITDLPTEDTTYSIAVYYAYSIANVQSNTITKQVTLAGTPITPPSPDPNDPNPGQNQNPGTNP